MGRGNTENCAAPWDAATQRTARQHGTRKHVELRGNMGRGNTENCAAPWDAEHRELRGSMERGNRWNCAAPWDAATHRTPRQHGTRQHVEFETIWPHARHHG